MSTLTYVLIFAAWSLGARAHVRSESNERVKLKWPQNAVPLVIQHNSSDIASSQSAAAVAESISAWNAASAIQIVSSASGANTLSFSNDPRYFGPGVVAVTALDFSPGSGRISSGTILLNESNNRTFCFTASKDGSTGCAFGFNPIFVGDVVSHELGHFLGLAHSEVHDSTMLYIATRGQYSLHPDDVSGVRSIYSSTSSYGSITGLVKGGNQVPVFGAHVEAISARTGKVEGASLSDENGSFRISGLNPVGVYYLYVSPLANPSTMPDPFFSVKKNFCPGNWVGSFFEKCGEAGRGHPQPVALSAQQLSVDVGTVTIRCHLRLAQNYLLGKLAGAGGEQEFVATASKPVESFVGHYPASQTLPTSFDLSTGLDDIIDVDLTQLQVPAGSPRLEFRVLTAGLSSQLDFSIAIDGPFGVVVDPDRVLSAGFGIPTYDLASGKPMFERTLTYPLHPTAALNSFRISLKPRALTFFESTSAFPSDEAFNEVDRPWLAWASVIQTIAGTDVPVYENRVSALTDNQACMDAPYAYRVTPNPVSSSAINAAINGTEEEKSQGPGPACGSVDLGNGPSGGGGMFFTAFVGAALILLGRKRSVRHAS